MKRLSYILTLLFAWTAFPAVAGTHAADTVIIELGNNTRIIIYVPDAEGLKELENYDLNAMLKDLNLSIDSSGTDTKKLVIEDESGENYLSDTTIVLSNERDVTPDFEQEDEFKINLWNYRITAKVKDWDEYEEEFEDWEHGPDFEKSERIEEGPRSFSKFAIDIGMNNYLENGDFPDANAEPYAVRPWGSWYVGLGWTRANYVSSSFLLEWGGNFTWYNFKLEDDDILITKGPEMVEFNPLPSEIDGQKSKLTASYFNVYFVPMFDLSGNKRKVKSLESGSIRIENYKKRGVKVGIGVYGGYRLGSHSKIKFEENGSTDKDKEHNSFFLQNWRYGVRARVGIRSLDLFFNYDLNDLFAEGRGPELNAFSFGIIL
jgi:hypothetical protein